MFPVQDTIPSRSTPVGTYGLIAANALVFYLQLSLPEHALEDFIYLFGIVPARYTHPEWAAYVGFPIDNYWPFLTSMFLHGGWLHILGNMWTLWIFGDNVEDRMGTGRFIAFYLLCGIAAGAIHLATNSDSTIPTVGASGAIAGVMGAYLLLFPHSRIVTMVPIFFWPIFFDLPAFVFLVYWFAIQLFSGTIGLLSDPGSVGGIAWWAHIGGFIAGLLLCGLFAQSQKHRRRRHFDEYGTRYAWTREW